MDRNNGNSYNSSMSANTNHKQSSTSSSQSISSMSFRGKPSGNHNNYHHSQTMASREPLTQHDELIRYIKEAWMKVNEQGTHVVYHKDPDTQLKNFKPFNLEEFWGQRLVQNLQISQGQQQ